MPRRARVTFKKPEPDPIYGNETITKLINRAMYDGKKSVAQKEVYTAFEKIEKEMKENPVTVFLRAMENIKPVMEVRPRRIGGAAYQVPTPVRGRRQESLSLRWLIESARSRSNTEYHTFADKLASEIMDASRGEGNTIKKRLEVERIAEANRAFAHFKW